MGYKYTGDSMLGVSLNVNTPKPLDIRTVVDTIEDLFTLDPKTAYNGMCVANVQNGNIYMLIDKNHISDKSGWKASYEAIQIITCTQAQYKEWSSNTTDEFQPVDPGKDYLHQDTYYYIYEDSLDEEQQNQEYLSASWGKQIEEQLKDKALNSTVLDLQNKVQEDIKNLSTNYLTKEQVEQTYLPKTDLDTDTPDSKINTILDNYYDKSEVDDTFVTKESLRGEGIEGDDDFVFVTKKKYDEDQAVVNEELQNSVKTNSDAVVNSITTNTIKSPDSKVTLTFEEEKLLCNNKEVALSEDVPNAISLSESEYKKLQENTTEDYEPVDSGQDYLKKDTYYYVYPDGEESSNSYVDRKYLEANYSTTNQYQLWVAQNFYKKDQVDSLINELKTRIEALEAQQNPSV